MPTKALLLVLAAACFQAAWNLFARRGCGGMEVVWIYSFAGRMNLKAAVQPCDAPSAAMFARLRRISIHHPLGEPRCSCEAQ